LVTGSTSGAGGSSRCPADDGVKAPTLPTAERILDAARNLFSEKGFDAASISEIGRSAGVSKSLFYHYFRTKEDVLKAIFVAFFEESEKIQRLFFQTPPQSPPQAPSSDAHGFFIRTMLDFLRRNESVLRIILRENMNRKSKVDVFSFFDASYEGWRSWFRDRGWPELPQPDGKVFVFFFTFLSSLSYVLFHQGFTQHFHFDPEVVEEKFVSFFTLATQALSRSMNPSSPA
jgi:hypothetical protein